MTPPQWRLIIATVLLLVLALCDEQPLGSDPFGTDYEQPSIGPDIPETVSTKAANSSTKKTATNLQSCLLHAGQLLAWEHASTSVRECFREFRNNWSASGIESFDTEPVHEAETGTKSSMSIREIAARDWDNTISHSPLLIVLFYLPCMPTVFHSVDNAV